MRATLVPFGTSNANVDSDGLPDSVGFIIGTSPNKDDIDNDSVSESAEFASGTDHLSWLASSDLRSLSAPAADVRN